MTYIYIGVIVLAIACEFWRAHKRKPDVLDKPHPSCRRDYS